MKKYLPYIATIALCSSIITSPLSAQGITKNKNGKVNLTTMSTTAANEADYELDKLVIKTKANSSLSKIQLNKLKAKVYYKINELNYTVLKFNNEKQMKAAIKPLRTYKNIESIKLSPIYKKIGAKKLNDPKASKQYMHKLVKSNQAQKLAGKNKVKVAIIDSGIDSQHPDLKGNIKSNKNFVNPLHIAKYDEHGTHVAGIIGAKKGNGLGGYGINPNAIILAYDVFGDNAGASDYVISKAILQATKDGAKVINMSLGTTVGSDLFNSAVQYAFKKGVTIVAGSGNSGDETKSYPASFENVISVNSLNNQKKKSEFSSFGIATNVIAPGEDIYSTSFQKRGSSYEDMSGTSMASPVVTGVVSLLLAKNPKLNPTQVKYIIENTAEDLGEKGFDKHYANGLVNAEAALKYNTKKLPSFIQKKWTDETIKNESTKIEFNKNKINSFKNAGEKHWYAMEVKKGQKIQISALGDAYADLKLSIHFYTNSKKVKSTVNLGSEGIEEAKYIVAPFTGTLAIGVSDVNTLKSFSPYTLKVVEGAFPKDESSRSNIMILDSLNQILSNQFMHPSDEGDEDILQFKATKDELVEINASNIPGVDMNISVYDKKSYVANYVQPADQAILNDEAEEAIVSSNSSNKEKNNILSFETKKGEEYYIVVNNQFKFGSFEEDEEDLSYLIKSPEASLIPYSLALRTKSIPADEDSINKLNLENEFSNRENSAYDFVQYFKKSGLAFNLNGLTKGHINGSNDVDGFYINSEQSAIYSINVSTGSNSTIPLVRLYDMTPSDEKVALDDFEVDNNTITGKDNGKSVLWSLKPNTNYLVKVEQQVNQSIPLNGYEISTKRIFKNNEDKYENNNTESMARSLPYSGKLEANFSNINDVDNYYYTAQKNGIVSVRFAIKKEIAQSNPILDKVFSNIFLNELTVIKDTNNNKEIDEDERLTPAFEGEGEEDFSMQGSFEVKRGESYFIVLKPTVFFNYSFSMQPYLLNLKEVQMKDEDHKNVIKKNKPSKTIKMKKKAKNSFERIAYLNPGQINGDEDWYTYKVKKKGTITATLKLPQDLDGIVTMYKNGKRVMKVDSYGDGETEKKSIRVSKGQYYFKVTERFKRASADPYTFSIKMK